MRFPLVQFRPFNPTNGIGYSDVTIVVSLLCLLPAKSSDQQGQRLRNVIYTTILNYFPSCDPHRNKKKGPIILGGLSWQIFWQAFGHIFRQIFGLISQHVFWHELWDALWHVFWQIWRHLSLHEVWQAFRHIFSIYHDRHSGKIQVTCIYNYIYILTYVCMHACMYVCT